MAKKDDLARIIEIDAIYGEISTETAKQAKGEASGAAALLVVSFLVSGLSWAAGAGMMLAGWYTYGVPVLIFGGFFSTATRYFKRQMDKHDDILLAYNQRERLKELRGDYETKYIAPPRAKNGKFLPR